MWYCIPFKSNATEYQLEKVLKDAVKKEQVRHHGHLFDRKPGPALVFVIHGLLT